MDSKNIKLEVECYHCGDYCSGRPVRFDNKDFCCEGCKSVYTILNKSDLCEYYDLNSTPGVTQKVRYRKDKFAFLDLVEVQQKLIQYSDAEKTQLTFYLPQIHCSSCLWLLEHVHHLNDGIVTSQVNFNKKEVFIVFNKSTTLREVVETLADIGYEPHISLEHLGEKSIKSPQKTRLYKIGIAGFCFSNIMMLSLPEYLLGDGVIEAPLHFTFKALTVLLSLPVFFYSASEFFVGAWNGIKHRYLNIDVPVALALILTFGRSLYEVYNGGNGYFDSMGGIVFFMLVGRWLQDKTYEAVSFDRDFKSFFPIAVNVLDENQTHPVTVDQLRPDDVIQIHSQEIIPVDAILSKGDALIDYSFVSGESAPVNVAKGEIVYAGGKQTGGKLELIVVKEVSQSYLTNLWNKESGHDDDLKKDKVIDTISTYFTYIVFAISAIAGFYWYRQGESQLMWNALTTILIIACPCALLLSSTFTNGNILRILGLNDFYLRSPQVIGKMSKISHIVFDKTGTLTQNRKSKVVYEGEVLTQREQENIARTLSQASHPASNAVLNDLGIYTEVETLTDYKLTEGKGVEAWIDEHYYKIGSPDFVGLDDTKVVGTQVAVSIDNEVKGVYHISNVYRLGILDLISKLKNKYKLSVISGDNDAEADKLKDYFDEGKNMFFYQRPQDKLEYIEHLQVNDDAKVIMIGDGLNDAGALRQSDIGIAVTDSNNTFTPASDGILHAHRLSSLDKYLAFAQDGYRIIAVSFFVSIIYNIVGLYFAVQGVLSPLIAAILMPSSSISIVLITYGMSQWLAKYRGLQTDSNHVKKGIL